MLEKDLLDKPKVNTAFAIHVWNDLPTATVGARSGPVFASNDQFKIKVRGREGHGAAPHQTVDPVVLAAEVILACQTIVSQKIDPLSPAVVTFNQIHNSTHHNIIPNKILLNNTLRALTQSVKKKLLQEI